MSADMSDDMGAAEAIESSPKPDADGFEFWQDKILAQKRTGDLTGALKTLNEMLPIYSHRDLYKRKLLEIKAEILRELGRETEAQQADLEIKKILEEG